MDKITFKDFERIMSIDLDTKGDPCIEIQFCLDNCTKYYSSWLGKMKDKDTKKTVYWFGLVEDGTEAYDYDSFEQFVNAKVIHGFSLKDIWNLITLLSIDASDVRSVLPLYLE